MKSASRALALVSALIASACASAPTKADEAREVHAFMTRYAEAWNAHDAARIARDFYRMGRTVEEQTNALKKSFADLEAQGYTHSDIQEIIACPESPETAWAGMRFVRLRADGSALPPGERASAYDLKRFPEGWRITKLSGGDLANFRCPQGTKP